MRNPGVFTTVATRAAAAALSEAFGGRTLIILIFHRVFAEPDPLLPDEPCARRFAAQLDVLSRCFRVLRLQDAVRMLRKGQLPGRAACITFDDGYANNFQVALPILQAKGVPATVFVAPGFLDGGRMFNDTVIESVRRAPANFDLESLGLGTFRLDSIDARRQAIVEILRRVKFLPPPDRLERIGRIAAAACAELPNDLMMTSGQLISLQRAGVEIGAHTVDHPILTSIGDDEARAQILDSKLRLESILGGTVTSFAYPNGFPERDFGPRHVAMVRESGFTCALTTASAACERNTDPFQLPRVASWDQTPLRFGMRLAAFYRARTRSI